MQVFAENPTTDDQTAVQQRAAALVRFLAAVLEDAARALQSAGMDGPGSSAERAEMALVHPDLALFWGAQRDHVDRQRPYALRRDGEQYLRWGRRENDVGIIPRLTD